MRAYIIRRLLLMIPTLLLVSILVFLLIRFIPGDVIDASSASVCRLMCPAGAACSAARDAST
ncbi:MAG: hypothetical protein OXH96_20105 [Spirochaetaceae bacterium]|nr:hypothetical protein [Spirochaetaceae bacterium]